MLFAHCAATLGIFRLHRHARRIGLGLGDDAVLVGIGCLEMPGDHRLQFGAGLGRAHAAFIAAGHGMGQAGQGQGGGQCGSDDPGGLGHNSILNRGTDERTGKKGEKPVRPVLPFEVRILHP